MQKTATTTTKTPSTGSAVETEVERNKRRTQRAQEIANMIRSGNPLGAPAMELHKQVTALEEELNRKRSQLMSILRFEKPVKHRTPKA